MESDYIGSEQIKRGIEGRILSTLKLNPNMTYNQAVISNLQSMGIIGAKKANFFFLDPKYSGAVRFLSMDARTGI